MHQRRRVFGSGKKFQQSQSRIIESAEIMSGSSREDETSDNRWKIISGNTNEQFRMRVNSQ